MARLDGGGTADYQTQQLFFPYNIPKLHDLIGNTDHTSYTCNTGNLGLDLV